MSGDASHESDLGMVGRIYFSHETLLPCEATPFSARSCFSDFCIPCAIRCLGPNGKPRSLCTSRVSPSGDHPTRSLARHLRLTEGLRPSCTKTCCGVTPKTEGLVLLDPNVDIDSNSVIEIVDRNGRSKSEIGLEDRVQRSNSEIEIEIEIGDWIRRSKSEIESEIELEDRTRRSSSGRALVELGDRALDWVRDRVRLRSLGSATEILCRALIELGGRIYGRRDRLRARRSRSSVELLV